MSLSLYTPFFTKMLRQNYTMPVGSGIPDPSVISILDNAKIEDVFVGKKVLDCTSAMLCVAGLWLLFDHLEECHKIAQSIETPDGSYWHAIMHRREGDFSNGKYWFRQVGEHEIFPKLMKQVQQLVVRGIELQVVLKSGKWDPFAFVNLCENVVSRGHQWEQPCRQIQQIEWQLLFDHCYRKAIG